MNPFQARPAEDHGPQAAVTDRLSLEPLHGHLDLVEHNAEVSRTDFRDVLYWAFGWDSDPRRLLWELRDQLIKDGIISEKDGKSLGLIGTHQGISRELERLCEMLQRGRLTVSPSQLETIKNTARRFRLPARVWESLAVRDG